MQKFEKSLEYIYKTLGLFDKNPELIIFIKWPAILIIGYFIYKLVYFFVKRKDRIDAANKYEVLLRDTTEKIAKCTTIMDENKKVMEKIINNGKII